MKMISSAEFRKTYPRLKEPAAVTVLGRVIGVWEPVIPMPDGPGFLLKLNEVPLGEVRMVHGPKTRQSERDAILRKVNKG